MGIAGNGRARGDGVDDMAIRSGLKTCKVRQGHLPQSGVVIVIRPERKAMLAGAVLAGSVCAAMLASDAADAQTRRQPSSRARVAPKPAPKVAAKPVAPAAAVPAPPPAPVPVGTDPQPVGNIADWFPAESYPPQARALGLEGRTAFALDIDALGRVTQCRVLQTSGSDLLDSATCTQAIINGRFRPGRDAAGKPVPRAWQSSMRWKLTQDSEVEQ